MIKSYNNMFVYDAKNLINSKNCAQAYNNAYFSKFVSYLIGILKYNLSVNEIED